MRPYMVRVVGVEPTRLSAQEPKSCTSANSAIPAYIETIITSDEGFVKRQSSCNRDKSILPVQRLSACAVRKLYPRALSAV